MSMSIGQTILLKSIASMAKSYFDKNPTEDLKINLTTVQRYITEHYPEFTTRINIESNDVIIILSKNEKNNKR